ncbi:MAG: AAA family ATPase [Halorhabdus sp.]
MTDPASASLQKSRMRRGESYQEDAEMAYERGDLTQAANLFAAAGDKFAGAARQATLEMTEDRLREKARQCYRLAQELEKREQSRVEAQGDNGEQESRQEESEESSESLDTDDMDEKVRSMIEEPEVDFSDYVGQEDLKQWMKNKMFGDEELQDTYGVDSPNGVLLWGYPGTGKSYFARCLAGEVDMPFVHIKVPEITSKYINESAQLIKDVFQEIREKGPMLVCIDEIDSVAMSRDDSSSSSEQKALNQLLEQVEAMGDTDSVIIGTTNKPDDIDYAITRPGRFTKKEKIGMPGKSARRKIISMNMKDRKKGPSWDLDQATQDAEDRTPAAIEEICNEAAVIAMERHKSGGSPGITNEDFREAEEEISG